MLHPVDGLRAGGGKHEFFPVSMAPKAKELKFKAAKLKAMSISTDKVIFKSIVDRRTGNILPEGLHHKSKASSHFHYTLMEELQKANSKKRQWKLLIGIIKNI